MSGYRYTLDIFSNDAADIDKAISYLETEGIIPHKLIVDTLSKSDNVLFPYAGLSTDCISIEGTIELWPGDEHEDFLHKMSVEIPGATLEFLGENMNDPGISMFKKGFRNGQYKEIYADDVSLDDMFDNKEWVRYITDPDLAVEQAQPTLESAFKDIEAAYAAIDKALETLDALENSGNPVHPSITNSIVSARLIIKDQLEHLESVLSAPQQEIVNEAKVTMETGGLSVKGHIGTWYSIDEVEVDNHKFFLMEHEEYGDEAACIIVDERGELILSDIFNGFDEDTVDLLQLEVMPVDRMPDASITVADMKEYGYNWGGMLPMNAEAAAEVMKHCTIYRLYEDDSEGMIFDECEIADHAKTGGIFGVEKVDWQNYLTRSQTIEDISKDSYADILNTPEKFRYQLLSRMKQDCEYYLGYGNRAAKHLWAGSEKGQIERMKAIWNSFPASGKPEWLSFDDILAYEQKMCPEKVSLNDQIQSASAKASGVVDIPKVIEPDRTL